MNDAAAPAFEVRDSHVHGLGAFATRDLRRGERLGLYAGRRWSPAEIERLDWDNALTYFFGLSDGSMIDGREGGNGTRHFNHSCAPNCAAYEVEDEDGRLQIAIEARRAIRAGEELFIDYSLDIGDEDPAGFACHCGAPRCRGTMAAPPLRKKARRRG
ncbi:MULTISPECIES: SET domain-containing protein [unclassified Rubrivivax]|uniref:SET domain-containing protein n=1 Tax=unclassified Rubrivivax TaxID=2649762 RepID=UPI001E60C808|nr:MULTISPECIES: SET domain-containing protein-lysine N-methyltransferase [unclassified Rubrivivax]MCC9596717.1 SET domain-containing protein-lysine N-methyltransferase [Rubrivivax sp. JA1055]MCC9648874.1 SET domain-containing protein-lysine N-methyltransferase [Rubrivivax sp. JA1029]